ncbi:MAG: DUF488 family protein [Steroidobacteraceae bacterium]
MNAPAADDRLDGFKTELPLASDVDVCIKRIYEKPVRRDGYRVLVDRLWPRGIKKESAALDEWLRDIAPTTELREWFAHEPGRWSAFRDRYLLELGAQAPLLDALRERAARQRVTLLYAARDKKMNHAVVLEEAIRTRTVRSAAVESPSGALRG